MKVCFGANNYNYIGRAISCVFLGIFGIFFIIIQLLSFNQTQNYIECTAIITDIQTEYTGIDEQRHYIYVDYEIDGQKYSSMFDNTYNFLMRTGKEVTIKYNPDNVLDIIGDDFYFMLIFGSGAILIGVVGVILLIPRYKIYREIKKDIKYNKNKEFNVEEIFDKIKNKQDKRNKKEQKPDWEK